MTFWPPAAGVPRSVVSGLRMMQGSSSEEIVVADGIGWLLEPHLVDCVTFVRGIAPTELAGRLGAPSGQTPRLSSTQDAEAMLTSSACVARVGEAADWSFAVEYGDAVGSTARGLASASRDGVAAVNFSLTPWHPPSRFAYYIDGAHLCSFGIGEEDRRHGNQPDHLVPDLEKTTSLTYLSSLRRTVSPRDSL